MTDPASASQPPAIADAADTADTVAAIDPVDPMAAARRLLSAQSTLTARTAPGEPGPSAPADGPSAPASAEQPSHDPTAAHDTAPDEPSRDDADDDEPERFVSPYDRPGRWYVVHTQSGYEKKVQQNLEARIASLDFEERIHEIAIPTEEVVEFKSGRKIVVQKKVFPGYLLIRCQPSADVHQMIRETPGITGYAGPGGQPSSLRRKEVENFLTTPETHDAQPRRTKPSMIFEANESVRIKEGPFADFLGQVIDVNEEQFKVKVLVNIFGRETPVELDFVQVAKI